jgi:hypothetical protein
MFQDCNEYIIHQKTNHNSPMPAQTLKCEVRRLCLFPYSCMIRVKGELYVRIFPCVESTDMLPS